MHVKEKKTEDYLPGEGILNKAQTQHTALDLFSKIRGFEQVAAQGRSRGDDVYAMPVISYQGGRALVDGGPRYGQRELVVMNSADYLGLAHNPQIIEKGVAALREFGTNAASVPVYGGTTAVHKRLEENLAAYTGARSCVLFPTGYAANMGVIQALCAHNDVVVLDRLCHFSIMDGVALSGAQRKTFRHSDPGHLEEILRKIRARQGAQGILIIIEGVYGLDGDVAPLAEIQALAARFDARLMIDEAHSLGVIGPQGRGAASFCGVERGPDIISGSLSKALGCPGGFIASEAAVTDYLRFFSRAGYSSVAMQTACVAIAIAAIGYIHDNMGLTGRLSANADYLREGLCSLGLNNVEHSRSAIMSVIVGGEDTLRDISRELFLDGVWSEALPYPAVAPGQARIRFRVSAAHTREDLDKVIQVAADVFRRYGI